MKLTPKENKALEDLAIAVCHQEKPYVICRLAHAKALPDCPILSRENRLYIQGVVDGFVMASRMLVEGKLNIELVRRINDGCNTG